MREYRKRDLKALYISAIGSLAASLLCYTISSLSKLWLLIVFLSVTLLNLTFFYWWRWREAGKIIFYKIWNNAPIKEINMLSMAEKSFSILTVSGRTSINPEPVEELLEKKITAYKLNVRILLFDPRAVCFKNFIEGEKGNMDTARSNVFHITENLLKMKERTGGKLEIHWYSRRPVWRFVLVDDQHVFLGYHSKEKKGYFGPMLRASAESWILDAAKQYFEEMWESSTDEATIEKVLKNGIDKCMQ